MFYIFAVFGTRKLCFYKNFLIYFILKYNLYGRGVGLYLFSVFTLSFLFILTLSLLLLARRTIYIYIYIYMGERTFKVFKSIYYILGYYLILFQTCDRILKTGRGGYLHMRKCKSQNMLVVSHVCNLITYIHINAFLFFAGAVSQH